MTRFSIYIYRFFKRHKVVFYTILFTTTILFAWFGSKIKFEEDITRLFFNSKGGVEKFAFANLKVKDKVFIMFHSRNGETSPEELIEICDEFVQTIIDADTIKAIENVLYKIEDEVFEDGLTFLYDNAPVFVEPHQYSIVDSLLQPEILDGRMADNRSLLSSSSGMAYRNLVMHDPIGLREAVMPAEGKMDFAGDYILYENHFFTADTTVAVAFLSPGFESFDSMTGTELVLQIRDTAESFMEEYSDVEILYQGSSVRSVSNSQRIRMDLLITVGISLILIFILLLVCYKNKSTLFYLTVPVIHGVLFALAVMHFVVGSMSLMALGIGAIVMGVAFSYCLHVISHFKYVSDPEKVIEDQAVPLVLGSFTTICAFLGLLLTESELLHDFGLFASLGLLGTTGFALFFLPQFFKPENNRRSEKAFAILDKINSYPLERKKLLIIAILLISVVCFFKSKDVKFDSNLRSLGYNNKQLVDAQNLIDRKRNGLPETFYFAAVSPSQDSAIILSQELCKRLDQMKATGNITDYGRISSILVPKNEQQERISQWKEYWTAEKVDEVRQKVTKAGEKHGFAAGMFTPFFNMLEGEYEPVSIIDSEVIPEAVLSNLMEFTDDNYLVFIPVHMDRDNLWHVGDEITGNNNNFLLVDPMYYASDMIEMLHRDFDTILGISSTFVLIVLLLSLRSVMLAFLAFLPMGLSWYIVLGCMAMFGMEFNLINIIISSFIFGIGDDYSIFIMDGLVEKYRSKRPLLVFHKTAIFFSAIILIIVVVSLLFALHPAIRSIGVATLIGMCATILIAYTLQPFLFGLLITNRAEKGKSPLSLSVLYWWRDSKTKAIYNNYIYKGNDVESALTHDMEKTMHYMLLEEMIKGQKSILDFGCGFGFSSYWAAFSDSRLKVAGFDTDEDAIALANNCYKKSEQMQFSLNADILEDNYDVVIVNKQIEGVDIAPVFSNANVILIRKELDIIPENFREYKSDELYQAYIR